MNAKSKTFNDMTDPLPAGNYILVRLGEKSFVVNIDAVGGFASSGEITLVHDAPEYLKGIISMNGQNIPILDIRYQMGIPTSRTEGKQHIMLIETVYQGNKTIAGILVDEASRVVHVEEQSDRMTDISGDDSMDQFLAAQIATLTRAIQLLKVNAD